MARRYEFYVRVARTISHSFAALTREILLLPRVTCNYRLAHLASELSRFTCTSSLTMNEKFQYRIGNFSLIVSERVQLNPDNSRAMSALTFLLFKLNILQTKIVKL